MARRKAVTVAIDIVGDAKGVKGPFREASGEARSLSEEVDRVAASAAAATIAYKGFGKLESAAETASFLQEMQALNEQVFGPAATEQVLNWSASAADAFGQSESDALRMNAAYGVMLTNMNIGQAEAADWSLKMSALASDMAAAWETDVPQALEAIESALAGNIRPLRNYGIYVDQNTLKEDARALGINKTIQSMNGQERALTILNSIMRQGAAIEGTFAREKEQLNQQISITAAEAKNAEAAFGQGLIPIFQLYHQALQGVARAFQALPDAGQTAVSITAALAVGVAGLTLAFGLLVPAMARGWAGLKSFGGAAWQAAANVTVARSAVTGLTSDMAVSSTASTGLATRLRNIRPGALAAGAGIGILTTGLAIWMQHQAQAKARAEEWTAEVKSMAEEAERTGIAIEQLFTTRVLLDWASQNTELLDQFGLSIGGLGELVSGSEDDFQAWASSVSDSLDLDLAHTFTPLVDSVEDLRSKYHETREASERYTEAAKALGVATNDSTSSIGANIGALDRQTSALQRAQDAIERRYERVREQFDLERSVESAARATADAEADLVAARREAARANEQHVRSNEEVADAHRGVVDAVRGVREAEQGLADAHRGVAEAQAKLNDERAEAKKRIDEMREAVRDARLEEERADLTARQAARALLASSADPRLTDLEREDMALRAKEAQEAARDATRARAEAEADQVKAQRHGVESDEEVIEAHKRVAEAKRQVSEAADRITQAQERVAEAQRRVADASRQQANTMTEAKSRVEEAERRVEDAMLDEAQAAADLAGAQLGAAGSVQAHIDKLDILTARLDPNSPLRQRLEALRDELMWNATEGGRVMSGQQSLAVAERAAAAIPNVTVNQTVQGTPRAQRQAVRESFSDLANDFWRRTG